MDKALLVSHNGLGDNLFMIGALRFLLNFYSEIEFLCKNKYFKNVEKFFSDEPKIICTGFNDNCEFEEVKRKIRQEIGNKDILTCGLHNNVFKPLISNEKFKNFSPEPEKYTIDYDQIKTPGFYDFIKGFYTDIKLNLNHFFEHYELPETEKSKKLYESVKDYYLIFIQSTSSDGKKLNLKNIMEKHLNDDKSLLICNDENLYDKEHKNYEIANKFVYINNKDLTVLDYKDVIEKSDEIYIIDSAFTGVVLPYVKNNKLKTNKVRIILRQNAKKTPL